MKKTINRRQFAKLSGLAAVTSAVGLVVLDKKAFASGTEMVDPKSPTATGLGYVEKAAGPLAAKPCEKCNFYSGKEGSAKGPCSILGNKLVPKGASCNAFAPKS